MLTSARTRSPRAHDLERSERAMQGDHPSARFSIVAAVRAAAR